MGRISAVILGGAIDAAAALALAPKTGEQTRAFVAEKANAIAGEAKDFGAGLPGSAQDVYKAARERGEAFLKDAQGVAGGVANDTDADELREKIEAARQRIAAQVMENAEKAQEAAEPVAAVEEPAEETVEEAKHAAN